MKKATLFVPAGVLCDLEREANRHFPDESGGVLLGYADADKPKRIQAVDQIGPGPEATHERHRFEPDAAWQTERIAAAYDESGRVVTYLGDWHSHPCGSAVPSVLDRSTARLIARSREARAPHPLMMIVHGCPGEWQVAAYRWGFWRLHEATVVITGGLGDQVQ